MKRYIKSVITSIQDEDPETLKEIAETTTDPAILSEILYSDDYTATIIALSNPNLSISDMYAHADADWDYRAALAENPNLPDDLIQKLFNDTDSDVYDRLLWNPKLSDTEVQQLLTKVSDDYTRQITLFDDTKPIILDRLGKYSTDSATLRNIARNPNISSEILDRLSKSNDINVRCTVATNDNLSQETIQYMMTDSSPYVRECLAANPNISTEDLRVLAHDESARVRRRAEDYLGVWE